MNIPCFIGVCALLLWKPVSTSETPSTRICFSSRLFASTSRWQRLTSPGFPSDYANNLCYEWIISAAVGRKVVVEIDELSIEDSVSCASDYLLVSDGISSHGSQLGKYCGNTVGSVFSSSNYVTVTFHTDISVTRKGFSLKYKSTTSGCGQDVQLGASETQYIESPNYPFDYAAFRNADCAWTVSTNVEGSSITVKVVDFNLPSGTACSTGDYVILKEVDGTHENWLGRWCGSNGPNTQSVESALKVRFHADGSGSSSGFKLAVSSGHPTSEPAYLHYIGLMIGGVFVGILVLAVVGCFCCNCCEYKSTCDHQRDRSGASSVYSIPVSSRQGTARPYI